MEILSPSEYEMSQRSKVCGVDVHKQFFVAALLSQTGESTIKKFQSENSGLFEFKGMVTQGTTWTGSIGIHWDLLVFPLFHLGRSYRSHSSKSLSHQKHSRRKTDIADAQWIAQLAFNDLIKPSRIFPKKQRELRNLTRSREHLVNNRTMLKNRVHRILESASIKLSSVIADIFGKSGLHIVQGLLTGTDLDSIMALNDQFFSNMFAPALKLKNWKMIPDWENNLILALIEPEPGSYLLEIQ